MPRGIPWLGALALVLAAPVAAAAPPIEANDLDAFFTGALGGLMQERHIPGAVVLVVRDGAVVYARGFGAADLATGRPVDPATTLFRVASVSKLFTATAVMQLVEQGRLDLDADVNGYLQDMQVPAAFGKPITMRHLLTHTAGFDDGFLYGSERPGDPLMPLGPYLARFLPPRVQPPGALLSYSNHGVALAGHVVEQVVGQPFRDYLRERVLLPLGMKRSGFSVPHPAPPELAVGYDWRGGRFEPAALDRMRWAPAGDLYTSAGEISRFLLAHLAGGRVPGSDARILREETVRAMHAQAFTQHPALLGWCLGFEERRWNDVRAVGHGGSWHGYGTEVVLVPERNLALFVSTTRDNDARFFRPLLAAFFDRYFPPTAAPRTRARVPDATARASEVAGRYIPNRRVRHDFLKLSLLLDSIGVTALDDGSLVVTPTDPDGFDPIRALPVGPDLWRADREERNVTVLRDASGAVEHLVIDAWTFDPVSWWRNPELHTLGLAACALVFAGTLFGWSLGGVARAVGRQPPSSVPLIARAVAATAAAFSLAALGAVVYGLATLSPFTLFLGPPTWLRVVGFLPLVAIPLALGAAFALARSGRWTPLARLHYGVLALALFGWTAFAWSYNLIGLG